MDKQQQNLHKNKQRREAERERKRALRAYVYVPQYTCAVTYPIARRNPWKSHDTAACAALIFSSNCGRANPAYYLLPTSSHSITFPIAKH